MEVPLDRPRAGANPVRRNSGQQNGFEPLSSCGQISPQANGAKMKRGKIGLLKGQVAAACDFVEVRFGYLRKCVPIDAFYMDNDADDMAPRELAVSFIEYLCAGDGSIADKAICFAVVGFLEETFPTGKPIEDRIIPARDLWNLIRDGAPREQLLKWANANYR